MPAIGELKPAEIAAATPAPIMTSCGIWYESCRLRNAPKVPQNELTVHKCLQRHHHLLKKGC